MKTSKEENTQALGVDELGTSQRMGRVGCPRGEEKGRGREGMGVSFVVCGCWLDTLGTLGEVPLNRHED